MTSLRCVAQEDRRHDTCANYTSTIPVSSVRPPQRPSGHSWTLLSSSAHLSAHLAMFQSVGYTVYSIQYTPPGIQFFLNMCHTFVYIQHKPTCLIVRLPPPPPRCAISHYFCICATIATFCYPALRLIWHSVLYLSHTTTYNVNDKFWQYSFNVIQQSMLL